MATRRPPVPRAAAGGLQSKPTKKPQTHQPTEAQGPASAGPPAAPAKAAAGGRPASAKPGGGGDGKKPATSQVQERPEPEQLPVPARAFSGRLIVLAIVLVAVAVMLAPTVRVFINQRAELSQLQADIDARALEQEQLNQQLVRWDDPAYVKQQARDRINMVMPGETSYWVFGDTEATTPAKGSGDAAAATEEKPWAEGLWESIRRAAGE